MLIKCIGKVLIELESGRHGLYCSYKRMTCKKMKIEIHLINEIREKKTEAKNIVKGNKEWLTLKEEKQPWNWSALVKQPPTHPPFGLL